MRVKANFLTAVEFAASSLTTSYQSAIVLTHGIRVLTVINDSTVVARLSFDGTNQHFTVPSGVSRTIDFSSNDLFMSGDLQIKSTGAGTGTIYFDGAY
jgi:hypothetical protein